VALWAYAVDDCLDSGVQELDDQNDEYAGNQKHSLDRSVSDPECGWD
jgi:hypothetical protein